MDIVTVENLSFSYKGSKTSLLENINFTVRDGDFIILYGSSGCGKTTLLKLMKKELAPTGKKRGSIYYKGKNILKLSDRQSASDIGFVMQNPDAQIVTDKVYRELAFGLENLGLESSVIRRKTAEIAGVFGINKWYHSDTATLSGGQKQLLNLASVMVMSPKILLLDEPVSQLDPFSASAFMNILLKLNREYGVTVIIAEHNLEGIFEYADSIAVLDKGRLRYFGVPRTCCSFFAKEAPIVEGMPVPSRLFQRFGIKAACPVDVREAKEFLQRYCPNYVKRLNKPEYVNNNSYAVELENVYFRYDRKSPDIISCLDMRVRRGEIYAVVGGNGCGKTTLLSIISGRLKPYSGRIITDGIRNNTAARIGLIPQNPVTLFTADNLKDDLVAFALSCGVPKDNVLGVVTDICRTLGIVDIMQSNPYDLSGGEIQKAALAKLLISNAEILLLDEPTKGVDAWFKKSFSDILKKLAKDGKAVIIVTHDNDFAAETAHTCGMLFDGTIISEGPSWEFYSKNDFYTTVSARITKGYFDNAVTFNDVLRLCKENGGVK